MRSRASYLGVVYTPDEKSAEAATLGLFIKPRDENDVKMLVFLFELEKTRKARQENRFIVHWFLKFVQRSAGQMEPQR